MRLSHLRAAGLALALGLGAAGLARGDDPAARGQGNWFSRLFTAAPAEKAPEKKAEPAEPAVPAGVLRSQAKADWLRRADVCDRLREIALQTDDDELARQAEQLEQRAWDAYTQQLRRAEGEPSDAARGAGAPDGRQALLNGATKTGKTGAARAAGEKR